MVRSGGMPSSHSSTVTALAVAVGFQEGADSSAFAIALVMACVVCVSLPDLLFIIFVFHRSFDFCIDTLIRWWFIVIDLLSSCSTSMCA